MGTKGCACVLRIVLAAPTPVLRQPEWNPSGLLQQRGYLGKHTLG